MRALSVLCLTCVLVMAATAAQANVITWKGGSSYNQWSVAANWNGGVVPTAGDQAIISSGTASVNATLSPAPDLIRLDSGATATFSTSNANSWTLNGGTFQAAGSTSSGPTLLTANSIIKNTIGNPNTAFTISGTISEDGTPRTLTFTGNTGDNTRLSGTNTYTGGTIVTGQVGAASSGALGTGAVTVNGGKLKLLYSGSYTFGQVTSNGGSVAIQASSVQNTNLNLQGGSLVYNASSNAPATLGLANTVSISNTVDILTTGGYWNGPFRIGAGITGSGKAVLNNNSNTHVQFGSTQAWTGGTEIAGAIDMLSAASSSGWGSATGGVLPAGIVTVDGVPHSSYTSAVLSLLNTTAGANGGLNLATDLVLLSNSGLYGNLNLGTNVTVHTLTLDGVVQPAGTYSFANLPNWIVSASGTRTLTVTAPEPATLTLLVLAGVGLVARRRR